MESSQITFRDLIAENKRKSYVLVAVMCLFTAAVVAGLGAGILSIVDPRTLREAGIGGILLVSVVAGLLSLGVSIVGYLAGDQLILATSGARLITHDEDPELFNVVEEMAIAAGVPAPKVYLIDDSAPNAFATGRDPEHASVTVTSGLRAKLTRDELQGVIAHEMSHVRNYDIRLMLLMAVLVGTVAVMADYLLRATWFSGGRSRRGDRDSGGGALGVVILLVAIGLAIFAPVMAQIIQLAVSREREYLADAAAVQLTRLPDGLAGALRKIDADQDVLEAANRGTAHLYIANPIKKFEERSGSIFASHPPIHERIKRLEALGI